MNKTPRVRGPLRVNEVAPIREPHRLDGVARSLGHHTSRRATAQVVHRDLGNRVRRGR
jgi:hypothetical protein